MNRTAWLAALAFLLAPGATLAQFGGMGGAGGGMGGMGGMGGIGGGRGGMGMGARMGGGFGSAEGRRAVQVELEGGRRVSGSVELYMLTIYGDLGQHTIRGERIKAIRFLKPASPPPDDADEEAEPQRPAAVRNNARAMVLQQQQMMMGGRPANANNGMGMQMVRAKVVLDSGEEIIGNIPYGMGFQVAVDYGTMVPAMDKLRTMTFGEVEKKSATAAARAGAARSAEVAPGPAADRGGAPPAPAPPVYFRYNQALAVRSPAGDRIALYNIDTRQTLELSGPKDGPLEVAPLYSADVMALGLKGPKIRRIAVADAATGWHIQDLRRPAEGEVMPTVAQGIAVYSVGRHVYAYGVESHRWDIAELPEELPATPTIGPNTATIEGLGHIFTFTAQAGRWDHIDVRNILDATGAGKK